MKAPLLTTFVCLVSGLLLAGSSGASLPQRGARNAEKQSPVEKNTRGASAKKSRRGFSRTSLEDYFSVGDYDANGFMNYREAHKSLAISRAGFARFDVDRDGLIDIEEFVDRYMAALLTGDSLPEPVAERAEKKQPARNAAQIRLAFDANSDGSLDATEVQAVLGAYEQNTLNGEDALARLDVDSSGLLEFSELSGLVPLLFSGDSLGIVTREPVEGEEAAPEIHSILDLFGARSVRLSESNAVPLPPQIVGPLDHFSRLDFDQDGFLTFTDLDSLMRPIQSSIRLKAVVATLDTNEDGVVSSEEFWASMRD